MRGEQVCYLPPPTIAFPSNEIMESPVLTAAEVDNSDDDNSIIGPTPDLERVHNDLPMAFERPQQSQRLRLRRGTPNRGGNNPMVDIRRRRREPMRLLRESFSYCNSALAYVAVNMNRNVSPRPPTSPAGGDFNSCEEGQTPGFAYFTILGLILGLTAALLVHHTFNPDRLLGTPSQPEVTSYNVQNSQPQSSPTQVDTLGERIVAKECHDWRSKVLLKSCLTKNAEYSSKVQVLQEQMSNLQHKFIETLDEKEMKMDKLVSAVKEFKQSHYLIERKMVGCS